MSEQFKNYIDEERVFLHNISNSLNVGQGLVWAVSKKINEGVELQEKDIERLSKGLNALKRMISEIEERRKIIKEIQASL